MARALGVVVTFVLLLSSDGFVCDATEIRILIDASKDGYWWSPQKLEYDPRLPHFAKDVADYLRSLGYVVTELPPRDYEPTTLKPYTPMITLELLRKYSLVIRPTPYYDYSSQELNAYYQYVKEGGRLLLLSGGLGPGKFDQVASVFGIRFAGIARGSQLLNSLKEHPITEGVFTLSQFGIGYQGSGIFGAPTDAQLVGFLSQRTYIDLNDNKVRDPNEPVGAPVLGVMEFGRGRIVFCGDTYWLAFAGWFSLTPERRLLNNILAWLLAEHVGSEPSG